MHSNIHNGSAGGGRTFFVSTEIAVVERRGDKHLVKVCIVLLLLLTKKQWSRAGEKGPKNRQTMV